MNKAVVLVSGGLDSATAYALATADEYEVFPIAFVYGQKHVREIESAKALYGSQLQIIEVPKIFADAASALTGSVDMPHLSYEELQQAKGPSPTVVPFRNGILIAMAAARAIALKAEAIYIGVHAEDAHNWAYPDCTPEFVGAMMNAVRVGSYNEVRLVAPLQYMRKADVLRTALSLGVALQHTWSCYDPVPYEPERYDNLYMQCGKCPTCVSRIKAFQAQGLIDPVPYSERPNWNGCITWERWKSMDL